MTFTTSMYEEMCYINYKTHRSKLLKQIKKHKSYYDFSNH